MKQCPACEIPVSKRASFCHSCGERLAGSDENTSHVETDHSSHEAPLSPPAEPAASHSSATPDEKEELDAFVGKNQSYYFDRWEQSDDPSRTAGWNWAAFFLSVFWLGYRKMYGLMILVMAVNYFLPFFVRSELLVFVLLISISIFLGLRGNAIYYRHAKKKIGDTHKVTGDIRADLARAGGTNLWKALGIFAIFVVAVFILEEVLYPHQSAVESTFSGGDLNTIVMGTGMDADAAITGQKTTFSPLENIFINVSFGETVGSNFDIYISKMEQGSTLMYDQWTTDINPTWDNISFVLYDSYYDPIFEEGEYLLQIFTKDGLAGEQTFTVRY
ncbi:DUF2628 domain-containing protein [Alteribacter natronophilus]|uniref:DUF2628 domain-containing protein n=1 Tax=Alteribacter natronophilus TaxID=2583810 RepID=UPI001486216E|nr:DUF2628 domain-containing protein [Alteribacter natronophilus]